MAEEALIAHLRATGQAGFRRAFRGARRDVRDLGDETDATNLSLRSFGKGMTNAGNSASGAATSLASTTGTLLATRAAAGLLTGGVVLLAAALATPLLASLGAAAAGLGALGIAAGGPLFASMLLAAGVIARFKEQADTAGTGAYVLSKRLDRLKTAANSAISPAASVFMRKVATALEDVIPLVGSLRGEFRRFGAYAGEAVKTVASGLSELRPELSRLIGGSGKVLKALAPAVAPFAGIMLDIANATMPILTAAVKRVASALKSWRPIFADVGRTRGVVSDLVDHLREWARLGAGVGKVMVGIGRALAPTGKGWVATLADGAQAAGNFLNSAKGIATVRGIFATVTGAIRTAVGFLGKLGGIAREAGTQLLDALKPAAPFLHNVLVPLFTGLAKGVLAGLVGAFKAVVLIAGVLAKGLGWLGTKAKPLKGVFEGIGTVLGFLFGGPILKGLSFIPKLGIVFKIAGGFLLGFGKIIGKVIGFGVRLLTPFVKVAGFLGGKWLSVHKTAWSEVVKVAGPAVGKVVGAVGKLWRGFKTALGWAKKLGGGLKNAFTGLGGVVGSVFASVLGTITSVINKVIDVVNDLIGAFNKLPGPNIGKIGHVGAEDPAPTGVVRRERGGAPTTTAEGGSPSMPSARTASVSPAARPGAAPTPLAGGPLFRLEVPVKVGRREFGRASADIAADDLARTG